MQVCDKNCKVNNTLDFLTGSVNTKLEKTYPWRYDY